MIFSYYDREVLDAGRLESPVDTISFLSRIAQRFYGNWHRSFGILWYARVLHSSTRRECLPEWEPILWNILIRVSSSFIKQLRVFPVMDTDSLENSVFAHVFSGLAFSG